MDSSIDSHLSRVRPGSARLIGRTTEIALLRATLDLGDRAESQLVLVSGEPGVGKSRLIAEIGSVATDRGWVVLAGGAYEGQRLSPYQPFVDAVRVYVDAYGVAAIRRIAGSWSRYLDRLLPELRVERRRTVSESKDPGPLFEACAVLLRRIAAETPTVLALDDLQWADPACLDLLLYLRRRIRDAPLVTVASYRDTDLGSNHPIRSLEVELDRLRLAIPIKLGRLDAGSITLLASEILRGPVSPGLAELLHRDSEGNPFIAEEILRSTRERDHIAVVAGAWDVTPGGNADLPDGVRDAVRTRLRRLPSDTYATLQSASVLGRQFGIDAIAQFHDVTEQIAAGRLAAAVDARLIEARGENYQFSHDKIRETIYRDISFAERRHLHDVAATVLESVGAGSDPGLVAYHYRRGTEPQRAIPYLLSAGRVALADSAFRRAADYFGDAARLLAATDQTSGSFERRVRLIEALLSQGTAQSTAGDYASALIALDEALSATRGVESDPAVQSLIGEIYERQGDVYVAREEPEPADRALQLALESYGPSSADRYTRVLIRLGQLYVSVTGDLESGTRSLETAYERARENRALRLEAEAVTTLGQAAMHRGDFATGRRNFEAALNIAERLNDPRLTGLAADGLARGYYWAASFHELKMAAQRELGYAKRTGDPHRLGWPLFWLTQATIQLGDWRTAASTVERLIRLGEELGAHRFLAQGRELRGNLALLKGDVIQAVKDLGDAIQDFRSIGFGTLVYYLGPLALALIEAGSAAAAQAATDETLHLARRFPLHSSPRVQACNVAALALLRLGRASEAVSLYSELIPAERQNHWHLVARTLGMLATAANDLSTAERHLTIAHDIATDGGGQVELANVLTAEAELWRKRHQTARAERLEQQATDLRVACGASGGVTVHPAALPGVPVVGGLSPREVEVLRLVAEGRTNRDISLTLSISEKTTTNHLTHIFNKIGCDNRAAATAFAFRNGLVGNQA